MTVLMKSEENFYKKESQRLTEFIQKAEVAFMYRQLGIPKNRIAKKMALSIATVDKLLDKRDKNIEQLSRLNDNAARRDTGWPY